MKTYDVTISRTYWATTEVTVEAKNMKEAKETALDSDYEIGDNLDGGDDEILEVTPIKVCRNCEARINAKFKKCPMCKRKVKCIKKRERLDEA